MVNVVPDVPRRRDLVADGGFEVSTPMTTGELYDRVVELERRLTPPYTLEQRAAALREIEELWPEIVFAIECYHDYRCDEQFRVTDD